MAKTGTLKNPPAAGRTMFFSPRRWRGWGIASALILRRPRSGRPKGWPQLHAHALVPIDFGKVEIDSFRTAKSTTVDFAVARSLRSLAPAGIEGTRDKTTHDDKDDVFFHPPEPTQPPGTLVGRVWRPDVSGPSVRGDSPRWRVSTSQVVATMRDLCESPDPASGGAAAAGGTYRRSRGDPGEHDRG